MAVSAVFEHLAPFHCSVSQKLKSEESSNVVSSQSRVDRAVGGQIGVSACKVLYECCRCEVLCYHCRTAAAWVLISNGPQRYDAAHLLSHHVQMPMAAFHALLVQVCQNGLRLE